MHKKTVGEGTQLIDVHEITAIEFTIHTVKKNETPAGIRLLGSKFSNQNTRIAIHSLEFVYFINDLSNDVYLCDVYWKITGKMEFLWLLPLLFFCLWEKKYT